MSRLEICIDSFESAVNAVNGGANQLEVCSALPLGGLTPSIGLVRRLRANFPKIPLFVMLRPRGGDFVYTDDEIEVMREDMRAMKAIGAAGFVFGIMDRNGRLDVPNCERLLHVAHPTPCTLHRCFDLIKDWKRAIEEASKLGFKAILTSGQAPTAMDGVTRLKKIRNEAGEKINIIVGSGVNSKTLPMLLPYTGCSWFHGSASVAVEPKIQRNGFTMGANDSDVQWVTSKEEVSAMREQLDAFFGSQPIRRPYY